MEWSRFVLGRLSNLSVEFRSRSLVEADVSCHVQRPDRLQNAQCAERVDIRGIFWRFERDAHVTLRR